MAEFNVYPRLVRPAPDPLALYIHIGWNDHRAALNMAAAGDFSCFGAVLDPTNIDRHKELLDELLERKLDVILDPRTQPSATPGGYSQSLGELPWGVKRPHTLADFYETSGRRIVGAIGDFVLQHGFTEVLAPTHLLRSVDDGWLDVDIETTLRLRDYLDRNNGRRVPIVYSLAMTYAMLRDADQRRRVIEMLQGVPSAAIWLRVDGFGSHSTPTAVLSYIEAAKDFRELGLPLVADYTGGMIGLSLLAFGAVGGIAHGITKGERFSAANWRRPHTSDGFSLRPRVYFPDVDLLLKPTDARLLLEASPRAKALYGCRDTKCCPRGVVDMLQNPAKHFLYKRMQEVAGLSGIPEQLRAQRFLDQHVRPATDRALAISNIAWQNETMEKRAREHRKRLDALRVALGDYEAKRQKQGPIRLPKTRLTREMRL